MTKQIFTLIATTFITISCFSQFDKNYTTELESFQDISKPSPNSPLSQYLIKTLGVKYLNRIKFSDKQKANRQTIRLRFNIYDNNKIGNFRINTGNIELNKKIIEIFKKYPIEKLGLNHTNSLGVCSVQLFSRSNKKTIINASTIAVCDIIPVFENCTSVKSHSNLSSCFYEELKNHIIKNFSLSIFNEKQRKKMKNLKFVLSFSIDNQGKIYNIFEEEFKFKSYMNNPSGFRNSKIINEELHRIIKLLDKVAKPAMRNGKPIFYNYDTFYSFTLK